MLQESKPKDQKQRVVHLVLVDDIVTMIILLYRIDK